MKTCLAKENTQTSLAHLVMMVVIAFSSHTRTGGEGDYICVCVNQSMIALFSKKKRKKKWRSASAHQLLSLCQDQSTVAQGTGTTVSRLLSNKNHVPL